MGNSQALAGSVGEGRVVAFGDSNGFTAMNFTFDDGSTLLHATPPAQLLGDRESVASGGGYYYSA